MSVTKLSELKSNLYYVAEGFELGDSVLLSCGGGRIVITDANPAYQALYDFICEQARLADEWAEELAEYEKRMRA